MLELLSNSKIRDGLQVHKKLKNKFWGTSLLTKHVVKLREARPAPTAEGRKRETALATGPSVCKASSRLEQCSNTPFSRQGNPIAVLPRFQKTTSLQAGPLHSWELSGGLLVCVPKPPAAHPVLPARPLFLSTGERSRALPAIRGSGSGGSRRRAGRRRLSPDMAGPRCAERRLHPEDRSRGLGQRGMLSGRRRAGLRRAAPCLSSRPGR